MNDLLREHCILNGFGFISNDNISRTHLWKDGIHLEDLGNDIQEVNFEYFLNRFILSKSSEHLSLYADKHLIGLYGNICILISDNPLPPEIVSDISNLGFVSSNWIFRNFKDYDKKFSLVIGYLNINSISNKCDNLKLIMPSMIEILVITETKTGSAFPLNQYVTKVTRNFTGSIEIEMEVVFLYMFDKIFQVEN